MTPPVFVILLLCVWVSAYAWFLKSWKKVSDSLQQELGMVMRCHVSTELNLGSLEKEPVLFTA